MRRGRERRTQTRRKCSRVSGRRSCRGFLTLFRLSLPIQRLSALALSCVRCYSATTVLSKATFVAELPFESASPIRPPRAHRPSSADISSQGRSILAHACRSLPGLPPPCGGGGLADMVAWAA